MPKEAEKAEKITRTSSKIYQWFYDNRLFLLVLLSVGLGLEIFLGRGLHTTVLSGLSFLIGKDLYQRDKVGVLTFVGLILAYIGMFMILSPYKLAGPVFLVVPLAAALWLGSPFTLAVVSVVFVVGFCSERESCFLGEVLLLGLGGLVAGKMGRMGRILRVVGGIGLWVSLLRVAVIVLEKPVHFSKPFGDVINLVALALVAGVLGLSLWKRKESPFFIAPEAALGVFLMGVMLVGYHEALNVRGIQHVFWWGSLFAVTLYALAFGMHTQSRWLTRMSGVSLVFIAFVFSVTLFVPWRTVEDTLKKGVCYSSMYLRKALGLPLRKFFVLKNGKYVEYEHDCTDHDFSDDSLD